MDARRRFCIVLLILLIVGASGCITEPETAWIHAGKTTRTEVVERYGPPDFRVLTNEGETVTYRARTLHAQSPRLDIPTAQVGPQGNIMTRMHTIDAGLGTEPVGGGSERRPLKQFRLRYDGQGIVQELLP